LDADKLTGGGPCPGFTTSAACRRRDDRLFRIWNLWDCVCGGRG